MRFLVENYPYDMIHDLPNYAGVDYGAGQEGPNPKRRTELLARTRDADVAVPCPITAW